MFNIVSGICPELEPYTGHKNHFSKEASFLKVILKKGDFVTKLPKDIFNVQKVSDNNPRKKKILVFICVRDVRDLLVSKHQMLPDKYYMGYDWKLDSSNGKLQSNGIKAFYDQIRKVLENTPDNITLQLIKYEELTDDPSFIKDYLENFELKVTRSPADYSKSKSLPYSSSDNISKGHEYSGITKHDSKWKINKQDADTVEQALAMHPELIEINRYFGYEEAQLAWANKHECSSFLP